MQYHNSIGSNSSAQAVSKNGGAANTSANNTALPVQEKDNDAVTPIQKYEIYPVDVPAGKNTAAESHTYAIVVDEHIEKDAVAPLCGNTDSLGNRVVKIRKRNISLKYRNR